MTGQSELKLGFAVPIFAAPGIADLRTPSFEQLQWEPVLDAVIHAEHLGMDSIWVADHMFLGRDGAILESWTALCALAGATKKVRLGNIHLGNGFRSAGLTAKMTASLDFVSAGRFDLFIDPGWREREHTAFGFNWEPNRDVRIASVAETIDICRATWSGRRTSYAGRFNTIDGAINMPRPESSSGPAVWVGEAFDDATLDLVVSRADVWNSMPAGLEVLKEKIAAVDEACRRRGRDPSTLAKTLETQVLILDDDEDWDSWLKNWAELREKFPSGDEMTDFFEFVQSTNPQLTAGGSNERLKEEFLVGTRQEVTEKLNGYIEQGISEIIFWFMDFPSTKSMTILAREIRPNLRSLSA